MILRQCEKYTSGDTTRSKKTAQNPTSTSPLVSWGAAYSNIYFVILLYGERKGSLQVINWSHLVITWKNRSFV